MGHLSVAWRRRDIRAFLRDGPHNMAEIVKHVGGSRSTVQNTLNRMTDVEKITGKGHPQYQLRELP